MADKIMVAYCHPGEVAGQFHDSIVQLLIYDMEHEQLITTGGGVLSQHSGPRIASARNALVRQFLSHSNQPDWLLMVDADMTFHPSMVYKLLESADINDRPVVGGLCFGGGRSGKMFPTMYRLVNRGDNGQGAAIGTIEEYPDDALVRVDATGCAFLLVHRHVYEAMGQNYPEPSPWFAETVDTKAGTEYGEDWTFCLRLARLGFSVYVNTGVKIGHIKPMVLDEASYQEWRAERDRLGEEGQLRAHLERVGRMASRAPLTWSGEADTTPTYVVMAAKDRHEMTMALIETLRDESEAIYLVDNLSSPPFAPWDKVHVAVRGELNLSSFWNDGIDWAAKDAAAKGFSEWNVCVMNNDVVFDIRRPLSKMSAALRAHPQVGIVYPDTYRGGKDNELLPTEGIHHQGGMTGFCFMFRGEQNHRFDETFRWYCGDTDFERTMREEHGGLVCRVVGLNVRHLEGQQSTTASGFLKRLAETDIANYLEKWGDE